MTRVIVRPMVMSEECYVHAEGCCGRGFASRMNALKRALWGALVLGVLMALLSPGVACAYPLSTSSRSTTLL